MENNKLIAEFMGINIGEYTTYPEESPTQYAVEDLQYQASWDWLMPVVQKCRQDNRLEYFDFVYYAVEMCDINVTYKAVIEFIKNQNN